MFYVLIGVLLKDMIKSSLLSEDEPLIFNIDKVMAGLKKGQLAKIGLIDSGYIYISRRKRDEIRSRKFDQTVSKHLLLLT